MFLASAKQGGEELGVSGAGQPVPSVLTAVTPDDSEYLYQDLMDVIGRDTINQDHILVLESELGDLGSLVDYPSENSNVNVNIRSPIKTLKNQNISGDEGNEENPFSQPTDPSSQEVDEAEDDPVTDILDSTGKNR